MGTTVSQKKSKICFFLVVVVDKEKLFDKKNKTEENLC